MNKPIHFTQYNYTIKKVNKFKDYNKIILDIVKKFNETPVFNI